MIRHFLNLTFILSLLLTSTLKRVAMVQPDLMIFPRVYQGKIKIKIMEVFVIIKLTIQTSFNFKEHYNSA